MKILLFTAVFFCFAQCNKGSTPEDPNNTSTPKLVWKTDLSNGESSTSIHPIISGNSTVFSVEKLSGTNSPLVMFNKSTGVQEGTWSDFFDPTIGNIRDLEGRSVYENNGILVFSNGSRVHAVDVKTRKTLWKNRVSESAQEDVTGIGNALFQSKYNTVGGILTSSVAKGNILTGQWETVFTDTTLSDFRNDLQTPIVHIDTNGDTLLYIVQTKYRFPPNEWVIQNLYCYNLSKRKVKFKSEIKTPAATNGAVVLQAQIADNKIVVKSGDDLVCFALYTGERLWQFTNSKQLKDGISRFVLSDNKAFVYTNASYIISVDLKTGGELWNINTNSGSFLGGMTYFNDVLYITTGRMAAYEASSGKQIWMYDPPTKDFFGFNSRIDKSNKRIYISDHTTAYCFEAIR